MRRRLIPTGLSTLILADPFGYYPIFRLVVPSVGVDSYVLLTLPPLTLAGSFDLHVLGTPPAFILSQDQTLRKFFVQTKKIFRLSFSSTVETQTLTFYRISLPLFNC